MTIKRKYVVDEQNHKIAVQLDIKTFEQIEELLENYALYRLMDNSEDNETLNFEDAKSFYTELKKTDAN
jgi:acetyl-CoA carboxylase beta subunit